MYFITNRAFKQSFRSKVNRRVDFDLNQNAPSNSAYFCRKNRGDDFVEIGCNNFMGELKESPARQLLFLLHGSCQLPETDIFPLAARLQELFEGKEKHLLLVVPVIWPCDNDFGVVRDHWDDRKSAAASAFAFARVLEMFMRWRKEQPDDELCLKRFNVLAHSLGSRVLLETLRVWKCFDMVRGVPLIFTNTFLVAPDLDSTCLERGASGEHICHASRNVTVYYAADDLVLRDGKNSNMMHRSLSRRLGITGPEDIDRIQANVYTVDCDNYNTLYDPPLGHTYFLDERQGRPGRVFEHIYQSVKTTRVDTGPGIRQMVLE